MASAFRNESLGLWYDAKSGVLQSIAELKSQVSDISSTFDFDASYAGVSISSATAQASVEAKQTLSSIKAEFQRFKTQTLE